MLFRSEDANRIKSIILRNGYDSVLTCNSAAQVISLTNKLDGGIILCGYRLTDMSYLELYQCLPRGFSMILLASPVKLQQCYNNDIAKLEMPLKVNDLVQAIERIVYIHCKKNKRNIKPKVRSEEQKKIILEAKQLLMEHHQMTEDEAHRYIQKISMDSGNSMSETAGMILMLK